MERTQKRRMLAGELYRPDDPEILADLAATRAWLARYNAAMERPPDEWRRLLSERLGEVGEGVVVRLFLNFNCVILDVVEIAIGEGTQVGPAVQIYAADHPRDQAQRRAGLEFGRRVHIGRNVWIGGGAIILPGVSVGDDAIVGAGSVVTRDVLAGATVYGNPARQHG